MKKSILVVLLGVSSLTFAQKEELNAVKKFIKKSSFAEATQELNKIENKIADTDYEATFYFLKGQALFGKSNTSNYIEASKAFYKSMDVEWRKKNYYYTDDAVDYINKMNDYLYSEIDKATKTANFNRAGDIYNDIFSIRTYKKDNLVLALYSYQKAKNEEKIVEILDKLLYAEYQGAIVFKAVNKYTNKPETFATEEFRNQAIAQGTHKSPTQEPYNEETRLNYYNALLSIYLKNNDNDKALSVLGRAKKEFPKNVDFAINYALLYYKMGKVHNFIQEIQNAIALQPDNKDWIYNLGVAYQETNNHMKAIEEYDKVIALDPKFKGAYVNKGLMILKIEAENLKKLNEAASANDKKRYTEIKEKLNGIYLWAIDSFEKGYDLENQADKKAELKNTLISLYKAVGYNDKAKKMENN